MGVESRWAVVVLVGGRGGALSIVAGGKSSKQHLRIGDLELWRSLGPQILPT